jgi:hypothetical protein
MNKYYGYSYIGTKIIQAEKMNLGDYNKYRGWEIPENEDPLIEGYLVRYSDGYISWSPKKIFEEAYRNIDDGCMTFGLAIEALKKGKKVSRKGWNGKNMWLCYMPPVLIDAGIVNGRSRKFLGEGKDLDCQGYIVMYTAQGKWQPGWLASQADMLSEDWMIVE